MSDTDLSPEAQRILENAPVTVTQDFLKEMAKRDSRRDNDYLTFEQYYSGENQRVRLTDRVRRYLQLSGFMWCENFCEVVVDVLCERLILESVTAGEDDTLNEWLDDVWKRNRMDSLQSVVHTNTMMKGDGYIIVDLDTRLGEPRINWNQAGDHQACLRQ